MRTTIFERVSLGCAAVVVGLASLACRGDKEKTVEVAVSASPAVTSAPTATTEEAPAVDAAVAKPAATPTAVAKNPCKDPDEVFLGKKCYRKCKADMDCDGLGTDCLPFNAANPTKVCRNDDEPAATAPTARAAAGIPKGAVVLNPDSFQGGGEKCPSGWQQVPSMNDAIMCNRVCTKDGDCHAGNTCNAGPTAGTKVCM
ncbi:MAG TPA: hypothetical protein VF316_09720 [Polyangiaceae bacterium]